MQVYPGYTVEKIEEEFSAREIDEICKTWNREPPQYADLKIIKEMIAAYLKIDLKTLNREPPGIDATIEHFRMLGF